jgi:orotidine-5'-phosphate decarboxylase
MSFQTKLDQIIEKNNSLVCVGLDSDIDKLPESIKQKENPQFEFNKAIIDATHDLVCSYKPNSAFYEAYGDRGVGELKMTCDYLKENYPEIPIIIDAKRGDIGNTNNGYVKFVFDYLNADAVTVIPYLGIEALAPFFAANRGGIIIGCHSSNPGAKEFQEIEINGKPLYHIVAEEIMKQYGDNQDCMIFMGATYPEELSTIRKIVGDMTILSPGVGAQEGIIEKVVKAGINSKKQGIIINSSRGIIFASSEDDFAEKARVATEKLRDLINEART